MEERMLQSGIEGIAASVRALVVVALLCAAGVGQTTDAGSGVSSGLFSSGVSNGAAPQTYAARTDTCETGAESGCVANPLCATCTGTGQPLHYLGPSTPSYLPVAGPSGSVPCGSAGTITQPSNGQYLCGINTVITDPDFGTTMVRATDFSLQNPAVYNIAPYNCGTNGMGSAFHLGSAGSLHFWSIADSNGNYKLMPISTGGNQMVLQFNPTTMTVTPSALCAMTGNYAFGVSSAHVIYSINSDQENTVAGTVTSGACVTPETMTQTGTNAHATLLAINPSTLVQLGTVTGTANNTGVWTGGTSSCMFTPNSTYSAPPTGSSAPYANTLYKGTINDSGVPSTWTITWSLLFNFNYVSGMGAPYFPTSASSCMPAGYESTYSGLFIQSIDDSSFSVVFSDNGQSATSGLLGPPYQSCPHTAGGNCTGAIYSANFTVGRGCRVFNALTDQITGDYGPTGQALNGEANTIAGTVTGTFNVGPPGEILSQASTGATTEISCTLSSGTCATTGLNGILVGTIYGTPDATHTWTGGTSGATLAPSGLPVNPPYTQYRTLHETENAASPGISEIGFNQPSNGKISSISANASTHLTTITLTGNPTYVAGDRVYFYDLAGADDQYLRCTGPNNCPAWVVTTGTTSDAVVVADTVALSSYTDAESSSTAQLAPAGLCTNGTSADGVALGYICNTSYWQHQTLIVNPCLSASCQGHASSGDVNDYRAKWLTAHSVTNPTLPCSVTGYTPCPTSDEYKLLPLSIFDDFHGTYNNSGTTDITPVGLSAELVCGEAPGNANAIACPTTYNTLWNDEILAIENFITNPSAATCNYGSGNVGCVYRMGHSFNSGASSNFNIQIAIANFSPDGLYAAFTSDMGSTEGCVNGATECYSSYIESGPNSASGSTTTLSTDASGNVTVTVSNQFCSPNGTMLDASGNSIACGPLAEQITFSGFNEAWMNSGTLMITSTAGCSGTPTTCTSFTGTLSGAPASYGPVSEPTAAKSNPVYNTGQNTMPWERSDIWIAKLASAK